MKLQKEIKLHTLIIEKKLRGVTHEKIVKNCCKLFIYNINIMKTELFNTPYSTSITNVELPQMLRKKYTD